MRASVAVLLLLASVACPVRAQRPDPEAVRRDSAAMRADPASTPETWTPPAPQIRRGIIPAVAPPAHPPAPPVPAPPVPASPVPDAGRAAPAPRYGDAERALAAAAWRYIEAETQAGSGLVNAVARYPRATMWDVGSGLAALLSARGLGLIDDAALDRRLGPMLRTLREMPLYNGELPSREIDTVTGRPVDLQNHVGDDGSGWSAIDLGRLALWLDLVRRHHPRWAEETRAVVARWQTRRLLHEGQLFGTLRTSNGEHHRQEGRLGYEAYAATGLARWGLHAPAALDHLPADTAVVADVKVAIDPRNLPFLTSEPYMLAGLELGGVDSAFARQSATVYAAQRNRWLATGEAAVFTEDALDRAPWFAYVSVVYQGRPFATTTSQGRALALDPTFSTKAALAWYALRTDPYAAALRQPLVDRRAAFDSGRGLYAGTYADGRLNRSLNVNTNGVALTALWVLARGGRPLVDP